MKETLKVHYEDLWTDTSGKEPKNHSPVLDYCRKLIEDLVPSNTSLEIYRHGELSMLVKNIGKAAKETIRENEEKGPMFTKHRPKPKFLWKKEIPGKSLVR